MRGKTYQKFLFSIIFCHLSILSVLGQIGINIHEPSATLDINGDLRIRDVPLSTTTADDVVVIDKDGFVKKGLASNSFFRGYLDTDFTSGSTGSSIYKITGFTIVDEPNDEIDEEDSTFSPAYSGLYNIILSLTATAVSDIQAVNVVYGLVDAETNKWIMRFSVPAGYVTQPGYNSKSGALNSFSGAVRLIKGKKYHFGVTNNIKLISYPEVDTGTGIGSYFSIELIKRD